MMEQADGTDRETPTESPEGGFEPEAYREALRSFLRRMGAGFDEEDLVQETLLRAYRTRPDGNLKAWLYCVALNLCRDLGRRTARADRALPRAARSHLSRVSDPAELIENRDLAARAWQIVQSLPERQRAALVLRIHEQFSYRKAAVALGCSEATARQHFYLGMKAVRDALGGGHENE